MQYTKHEKDFIKERATKLLKDPEKLQERLKDFEKIKNYYTIYIDVESTLLIVEYEDLVCRIFVVDSTDWYDGGVHEDEYFELLPQKSFLHAMKYIELFFQVAQAVHEMM